MARINSLSKINIKNAYNSHNKNKLLFDSSYYGKLLKKITPRNMSRNTTYVHEDSNEKLHDYDIVYSITKPPFEVIVESVSEDGLEIEVNEELIEKIKQKIINEQDESDNDDYSFENLDDE